MTRSILCQLVTVSEKWKKKQRQFEVVPRANAQQPMVTSKVQMTLSSIASRLQALNPGTSQQTTPMNFAVGALYALRRAHELGYAPKNDLGRGLRMWSEAKQLCQDLENGGILPDARAWLGGYFFNDGIIRISVAYEHLIREATSAMDKDDYDIEEAKRIGFQPAWVKSWTPVRKEVNRLKHKTQKFVDGPELSYDDAVQALDHLADALDRKNWVLRP